MREQARISAVFSCLTVALLLAAVPAAAQEESEQLTTDIRLFTVLTAINLAGYDQGLYSPSDSLVRQSVREQLADFDGSSLTLLKNFYEQFELETPSDTLSQYVSFALLCEPPPTFELKAEVPTDLPPDVRRLRPLSRILAEFYQQAGIEKLWSKYQPAYEQEIERYQEPLVRALYQAMGYLRISPTGKEWRGFKVLFDLMGGPNQINVRSYRGVVYVVVHPSNEKQMDEIRHAFLIHLLDPMAFRHGDTIAEKDVLARPAMFAPALPEAYKTNFQLLVTKSLAKAVEARLDRLPEEKKLARVEQALKEGYILTAYFYEKLAEYEKQGQEMRLYYKEMIEGIDTKKEAARLQQVEFAPAPAETERKTTGPAPVKVSEAERILQEAEMLLTAGELDDARKKFQQAMDVSGGQNDQALYGLARVAVSKAEADLAINLFEQAARVAGDPHIKAMSHVYLGRIADIMGNREEAVGHYQMALQAGDSSETTRKLAEQGLEEPFQSPRQREQAAGEEQP